MPPGVGDVEFVDSACVLAAEVAFCSGAALEVRLLSDVCEAIAKRYPR